MNAKIAAPIIIAIAAAATSPLNAKTIFYGPTPYLSAADSPFDLSGLGTTFWLEDFEDGELNTPGVIVKSSYDMTLPGAWTDSVDADDGAIDGLGTLGRSLDLTGVTCGLMSCAIAAVFEFQPIFDDRVPNAVGIVWTDGMPQDDLYVHAYDADDRLIGPYGPYSIGDDNQFGGTAEDRFFGLYHSAGIANLTVVASHRFVDVLEVDHLQYGWVVPEPATLLVAVIGTLTMSLQFSRIISIP